MARALFAPRWAGPEQRREALPSERFNVDVTASRMEAWEAFASANGHREGRGDVSQDMAVPRQGGVAPPNAKASRRGRGSDSNHSVYSSCTTSTLEPCRTPEPGSPQLGPISSGVPTPARRRRGACWPMAWLLCALLVTFVAACAVMDLSGENDEAGFQPVLQRMGAILHPEQWRGFGFGAHPDDGLSYDAPPDGGHPNIPVSQYRSYESESEWCTVVGVNGSALINGTLDGRHIRVFAFKGGSWSRLCAGRTSSFVFGGRKNDFGAVCNLLGRSRTGSVALGSRVRADVGTLIRAALPGVLPWTECFHAEARRAGGTCSAVWTLSNDKENFTQVLTSCANGRSVYASCIGTLPEGPSEADECERADYEPPPSGVLVPRPTQLGTLRIKGELITGIRQHPSYLGQPLPGVDY